jgi:cellulose synthase/poly-beta-1,6-N-acetylglucosamine synthase-like glycosyltransferase
MGREFGKNQDEKPCLKNQKGKPSLSVHSPEQGSLSSNPANEMSVVIPVCHGGRFLRAALNSTLTLDYPPDRLELLVTGQAEDAGAREAAAQIAATAAFPVRYIPCASASRAAQLNRACAQAQGQLLVFTDDDCILPSDWLRAIEAALAAEPDIGAVGGSEVGLATSAFDLALDWVLNAPVGSGGYRARRGKHLNRFYPKLWNMAVTREVVGSVALPPRDGVPGVFDDSLPVHEDVELMRRIEAAGYKLVFAPSVRVSHCRDTTFPSFWRRNFRMGRVCRREGLHRFPHRVLAAACVGIVLLAIAAAAFPALREPLAAVFGLYAALLLVSAIVGAAAARSVRAMCYIPLMLAGLHLARGLGYLFPLPPRRTDKGAT